MNVLLRLSALVDVVNEHLGKIADWMVLTSCVISAGNAMVRYAFNYSSNAWLEVQWYMFGVMFMLGASFTLKKNEHVRVDIVYGNVSERVQLWIDFLGGILFLLPATAILAWLSWDVFAESFRIGESSSNAGGLIRWPIKLMMPVGFFFLTLQGLSEVVKRAAALQGLITIESKYEKPLQ